MILELPLIPLKNSYGRAQREIAEEFGVMLVPKRPFARILSAEGGTVDGLHLSQDGHNAMARLLAEVVRID